MAIAAARQAALRISRAIDFYQPTSKDPGVEAIIASEAKQSSPLRL
jgi:hypothetical protein